MLIKIVKRCKELKLNGCIQALDRRIRKKWIKFCYRINFHKINFMTKKPDIKNLNIKFLDKIINSEEFNLYLPKEFKDPIWIDHQANLAAKNCFDLLGSGPRCFTKIPWRQDFKKPDKSTPNWSNFYQNIKASCPKNINFDEYNLDIKVPWELSRFQHIFVLGKAATNNADFINPWILNQVQDDKIHNTASCIVSQSKYSIAFQTQVSDWIENNPYLMGVNWVCPMEVSIRAINWIWGFYFFKDTNIPSEFWTKFIEILSMHKKYLDLNWETSDKPNNHYISDLVGYLYLCEFFNFKKEKAWCINKILEQFFHQINPDGSCYEGTTNYHKLDSELFLHFKLICLATQTPIPNEFLNRFEKMIKFMQACTDGNNPDKITNFLSIGDNDSGKILTGIEVTTHEKHSVWVKNYPNFGILIIKKSGWNISFRHPVFKSSQPTGHFHHDELAITLAIDGTPILVDPGSYVYTANSSWRNLMRNSQSHNNFYIKEPIESDNGLFQLNLEPQENTIEIIKSDTVIQATAQNSIKNNNKILKRKIELDSNQNFLKILDWIDNNFIKNDNLNNYEWNLIFNTDLELKREENRNWIVKRNNKIVCKISSTIDFVQTQGFYSKNYGILQSCPKLTASKFLFDKNLNNPKQIIFTKLA